jgi:CRISPR-associated protein Cas6
MKEMTDVVFALSGRTLPADHAYAVWRQIARLLPWLEAEPEAGILPLRAPERGDDLLLSRRARLVLRVPGSRAQEALQLSGQVLEVDGHALTLGDGRERPLQPHPTLHAQLVVSGAPEDAFLQAMAGEMARAGIGGKLICGRRHVLPGSGGKIAGYSLVVHELKPADALALQCCGLGGERHLGCGMFIPYKVIANLDGQAA